MLGWPCLGLAGTLSGWEMDTDGPWSVAGIRELRREGDPGLRWDAGSGGWANLLAWASDHGTRAGSGQGATAMPPLTLTSYRLS